MSNVCAIYQGCGAEERYRCQAYFRDCNCWEVRVIPCCQRRNKDRCEACMIYLALKECELQDEDKEVLVRGFLRVKDETLYCKAISIFY
ncbi:TPA: hypothetical protein DCX15_05520 [bacterium]|nr:hypothetical protein [bacterium]